MIRYYVTDRRHGDIVDVARRMIGMAVDMIQIREKDLDARALLVLAQEIVALARGTQTRILVNDRLDVALAAGAHGVHLPGDGLPVRLARPHIGLIGVSTHSTEEARNAERDGADFAVFGPVFDTPGKRPVGLKALEEVCGAVGIPVLAIGGLTLENSRRAVDAGAAGVAGIRMFQGEG